MSAITYGAVDVYVLALPSDLPDAGVVAALADLEASGTVRVIDFLVVSKDAAGDVTVLEIEDVEDGFGLQAGLEQLGILGDEDVEELVELVEPGTSAAIVAIEMRWMRDLSQRVQESGAEVLQVERIPAAVVNALVDQLDGDE
jgi:hypothetical protein